MTTIGRGRGRRSVYIPNNTGMAKRANRQLEAHAKSQAQKFNTAILVDSAKIVCWDNLGGAIPCSCSHARPPIASSKIEPGEPYNESFSALGDEPKGRKSSWSKAGQSPLGSLHPEDGFREKRGGPITWSDKREGEPNEVDLAEALSRDSKSPADLPDVTDPDDPFGLFNRKQINCSICMGTGFIDSWQPYMGRRIVLDTSNAYIFTTVGGTVDKSASPNTIDMRPGNTAIWLTQLPLHWGYVNRIAVYKDSNLIPADQYRLTWVTNDSLSTGDFTAEGIQALQGVNKPIHIIIEALDSFIFTHCEAILFFAQPVHGQLPEIQQTYEDEFADWGQNITVELPVGLSVKEGSYLSESKHNRVWKVNSVTHRVTAGGTEFGITAELRSLHSFETRFYQLAVFKSKISDRIRKLNNF